ncbi:uncharacterized protein LOC141665819 [Apium graveolens]|uniref:uncharacterized protein LOC141665819 n=1 Tax=Apium graveolens TaxID=4045 RepID=UPI003D78EC19
MAREKNAKAETLSKFASSEIEKSSGSVYFRILKTRSIDVKLVAPIWLGTSWIDPITIKAHILTSWLPNDVTEARKLAVRALRYEIPRILVTDNGTQFNNEEFKNYCEENEIELRLTSAAQKLMDKWKWTTSRVTTGATPFMLAYGAETVVPVKISHSSPRIQAYNAIENDEETRLSMDLIDEVRDKTHANIVEHQKKLLSTTT